MLLSYPIIEGKIVLNPVSFYRINKNGAILFCSFIESLSYHDGLQLFLLRSLKYR